MKTIISEFRLYVCNKIISHIPSHHIRLWFYRNVMKFAIDKGSYVFMGCSFDCTKGISIKKHSVINAYCRLDARGGIDIGENVSISNGVIILTADHDMDTADMEGRKRKVTIEDYVWIGTRAMIMPGVTIQKGAVVAAGAVVTKDVASFDVVAGVPAKPIRKRFERNDYSYNASYKRLFQ